MADFRWRRFAFHGQLAEARGLQCRERSSRLIGGGADGGGLVGQVYSELFDDGSPERLQDIFNALETSNEGAL